MTMNTATIGETLMLARKRAELTQDAVADALGVSKAYISVIERGRKRFPPHHLPMLPAALRRPVAEAMIEQRHAEIAELELLLNA